MQRLLWFVPSLLLPFQLLTSAAPAWAAEIIAPAQTQSAGADSSALARVSSAAERIAREQIAAGLPGFSVAVARDGQILFSGGYGHADVESGVAPTAETVYRIGSVTKQMTAAVIMRLVEQGKISLDDPITKYMPQYPTQGHTITIRHLLNHTSGIAGIRARQVDEKTRQRLKMDLSRAEILELFTGGAFDFAPGTDYKYNNSAYVLLGMIIEEVTGTPYAAHVERELFEPLGLTRTMYCDPERIVPDRAEGYEMKDGKLINAPYLSMSVPGAAGAICSSATDLVKWTGLLHSGQVVSSASLADMTAPTRLPDGRSIRYGFGLDLDFRNGREAVVHGGTINGFKAVVAHYRPDSVSVAVLANWGDAEVQEIEKTIAQALFGIEIHDLPLTQQDLDRYVGTYAVRFGERTQESTVSAKDGQLFMQPKGGRPARLRYQGEHRFILETDDDISVQFVLNGDVATDLTLQVGARSYPGTRIP